MGTRWVATIALGVMMAASLAAPVGAGTSPVLDASDLPPGYRREGPPRFLRRETPRYPSVAGTTGDCLLTPSTRFRGPSAQLHTLTFTRGGTGTGGQSVWTFPDAGSAQRFYARYRQTLERLPECAAVMYDHDGDPSTPPEALGTYDALHLGDAVDRGVAVELSRAGAGIEPRTAVVHTRDRVVLVQVADADMAAAEFRDLVATALTRADESSSG